MYKENIKTMKRIVILAFMITIFMIFGGCKKNYDEIENHVWKLDRIETMNGFSSTLPHVENPVAENRYLLRFDKESSSVNMLLVVNRWVAHYEIIESESIVLTGNTVTEIGYNGMEMWVEDTLNAYGSDTFRYSLCGNKLTLQSNRVIMTFQRDE